MKIFSLHSAAGGTLYWNGDEAFLFLDVVNRGHRSTYLRLLLEIPEEFLGVVLSTDDERSSAVVLRITPDAVQRFAKEDIHFGSHQRVGNIIYSRDSKDGILWKWSGTSFQQANAEEEKSLETAQRTIETGKYLSGNDYDNISGWSARYAILNRTPEVRFPMNIGKQSLTLLVKKTATDVSIEIVRPNGATETIWSLATRPRKFRKTEYERLFKKASGASLTP